MAKRVLLYGIRKEYSLKELPAIGKGIYGKPYFPEYPEICFNYSHADAGILCGIAETPLGVDIERLIHPTERLIRAVCHENEKKMLLAIEDPAVQIRYFSKIWTAGQCSSPAHRFQSPRKILIHARRIHLPGHSLPVSRSAYALSSVQADAPRQAVLQTVR